MITKEQELIQLAILLQLNKLNMNAMDIKQQIQHLNDQICKSTTIHSIL